MTRTDSTACRVCMPHAGKPGNIDRMAERGPGSDAVVDILADLGALPKGAVAAGRRLREMTSQARFETALRRLKSDERLEQLFREAVRVEVDQLADAKTQDQVLDVALRILLELQKPVVHAPIDGIPGTSHPWLVLEGPGRVRAACARVACEFDMRGAASFTSYVDLALSIRNVGSRAAEHVVVELQLPFNASEVSAWYGGARHDLDHSPPVELFDPHRAVYLERAPGAGHVVLRQRLRLVPRGSAETLIQVGVTVHAKGPGWMSRPLQYRIQAADGPHTVGEIGIDIGFSRGSGGPLRWEPRTSWLRNVHPEDDDLRIRRAKKSWRVPARDVVELDAEDLDDPANRHVPEWRGQGWLRPSPAPPWARQAPRTYVYRHHEVPRLLVHRAGARPRVLTYGAVVDLSAEDFEIPENVLLRRLALEKLVIPKDEDRTDEIPDLLAPEVDLGLQAPVPVDEDLRPIPGCEVRRQLVAAGLRPRHMTDALRDELLPKLVETLKTISDPNGVSAGTLDEMEAWLDYRVSPAEIRVLFAAALDQGFLETVELEAGDMFAFQVRTRSM